MPATVSAETHRHPSRWGGGRRARGRSECPSCIQICRLGSYVCFICVSQPRESVKQPLNSVGRARPQSFTSGQWSTTWPLRPFQSSSDWTASCCDCGLDVVKIPVWVKITIITKAKIHRATPIWLYSAYTQIVNKVFNLCIHIEYNTL